MKQRSEQSTSSGNRPMTGKSEVKQEKMTFLRRPARKYALMLENYLPLVRVSNISKHFGEGGARLDALLVKLLTSRRVLVEGNLIKTVSENLT